MEELLEFLKRLRNERREAKLAPDFVTYPELTKFGKDMNEVRTDLHALIEKSVVKIHQGINYELIEILKEEI